MIIKIVRTKYHAGMEAAWDQNMRRLSIPMAQTSRGMLVVYAGHALDRGSRESVVVTIWEDLEFLKQYSGRDACAVRLAEEERPLVEDCRVEVFECLKKPID